MVIELSIRADDSTFGRGDLAPRMDYVALGSHKWHAIVEGSYHVYFELQCGEAPARWQGGVDCATNGRVEQGREPASMHCAQRVVVPALRSTLEYSLAGGYADRYEVECVSNWSRRKLPGKDCIEDLHARSPCDLVLRCGVGLS